MTERNWLLEVDRLEVAYGPIRALRGCSLRVAAGETVVVVGANGAGKTTLLRAISNVLPHTAGEVRFDNRSTRGVRTDLLTRQGLLHVPEGRGVIARLTVEDNLRLAYDRQAPTEPFAEACARVFVRFPRLQERLAQSAGSLSGGEQQMLALARALINPPPMLLVDEPSLGLSPAMVREVFRVLREFKANGVTLLLVEQNVRQALGIADRAYVLRHGEIVNESSGSALLADPDMLGYYLGSRAA